MPLRTRTIVGLLLVCCACAAAANGQQRRQAVAGDAEQRRQAVAGDRAQRVATTCDRECLRGKVTQLLYALLKHDVSGLPVADTLRVTEDAVEKPLKNVGLIGTVT